MPHDALSILLLTVLTAALFSVTRPDSGWICAPTLIRALAGVIACSVGFESGPGEG
ncbi:hypothetical protein [Pseudogemmobacter humi]|uniref:Uncharacterized protein n=1 Tax=Pseudogemmobacter humi TaxID=2483812 RepID=A0A3P5WUQ0_9RHOB|nr:hypothetical protein [Pseudogemmobacter humi]VDC22920.1 hypothetical protein XINFAN_00862 [Pseudogemmobacter humi]